MSRLELATWLANLALEAGLVAALLRLKLFAELPWFVAWFVFDLARSLVQLGIYLSFTGAYFFGPYRMAFLISMPPFVLLMACAAVESVSDIQDRPVSWWVPLFVGIALCATSILAFDVAPFPKRWPKYLQEPMFFSRAFVSLGGASGIGFSISHYRRISEHAIILFLFLTVNAGTYLALASGVPRGWTGSINMFVESGCYLAWLLLILSRSKTQ